MGKFISNLSWVCATVAVTAAAHAQPAKAWTKTYGFSAPQNSVSEYVRCNSAGNSFVARKKFSKTNDMSLGFVELTKYSAAGAVMWTTNYGGLGAGITTPIALELDPAGNPILATSDFLFGIQGAAIITKINGATGATLWRTNTVEFSTLVGTGFAIGATGDIFIGGQGSNTGDQRMGVIKVSGATGAPIWNKIVTRAAAGVSDIFSDMAIDPAGNLALVGTARTSNFCVSNPVSSVVIARVNGSTGAVLWATTYTNNAADKNNNPLVAVDASSNVFAAATAGRGASSVWVLTRRAAANGAMQLNKSIVPAGFFLAPISSLVSDGAGGATICGSSFGPTNGMRFYRFTNTGAQAWTRLLADRFARNEFMFGRRRRSLLAVGSSALVCAFQNGNTDNVVITRMSQTSGATTWEKTYTPVVNTPVEPVDLALASNSDPVVASNVDFPGNVANLQAPVSRNLIASGNPVFSVMPNLISGNTADGGQGILIDGSGNTFSTGFSAGRIITQKHSSAGGLLWQNIFDNTAIDTTSSITDGGEFIGRDGSGNIISAGMNRGAFTVVKINGGTGATMWNRRIDADPGFNIAVGSNGDVFVPCQSPSQLIKLRSADGLPLWTAPVAGTGSVNSADYAAVDNAGNPYIAGTTANVPVCPNPANEKILIKKYSTVNGNLLWTRELAGPIVGANSPAGILIDTAGGVLIGGTSQNTLSTEIFGAKLFASTGGVLWNTRHDLGNKDQFASAIARDTSNNLIITSATSAAAGVINCWTVKLSGSNGARTWANLLTLPLGSQFPTDVKTDSLNNVFVGGVTIRGATTQLFGQKINGATGVQIWEALTPNGVILTNHSVSVAITPSNRLEMLGSVSSSFPGLSQMTLFQYLP